MQVADKEIMPKVNPEHVAVLAHAISSWYVRKDNKFYPSDRLTTKLSKEDVERVCLYRMQEQFPEIPLIPALVTEVFSRAIVKRHTSLDQSIPVWDGTMRCSAGDNARYLWRDGTVSVNSWSKPSYRSVVFINQPLDPVKQFFDVVFAREEEKKYSSTGWRGASRTKGISRSGLRSSTPPPKALGRALYAASWPRCSVPRTP